MKIKYSCIRLIVGVMLIISGFIVHSEAFL